jgi:hypothetical protein
MRLLPLLHRPRHPYWDTNSHSDVDTDRYADCYTNIYTEAKASPDSTASPNAAALTEIYAHPCSHPDRNTHV